MQREAQKLVPVDTGALKASAMTDLIKGPTPKVVVKFTQQYAIYVHEDLWAYHPVGQAKYLEEPYRQLKPRLVYIIAKEAAK